jgi:hypothetical protein
LLNHLRSSSLIDPVTVARRIAPDGDAEKASFIYYHRAAADTAVKQIVLLFHAAGYTDKSVGPIEWWANYAERVTRIGGPK